MLKLAFEFEKRRLEDAGGELAMGVIHLDEKHVHLHIYGLDRQRGSVNALHPGKAAHDAFRADHGALSKAGTNLFEKSKRAYCDAMREWQDDLHGEVFGRAGLLRYGPKRFRLSRPDYLRRKREEEERAEGQETIRTASAVRTSLTAAAEAVAAREENVLEEQDVLRAERAALAEKRRQLDEQGERLDAGLATVEAMAEGLLEHHVEDDGSDTIRWAPNAGKSIIWPELARRLNRAPQDVLRIGVALAGALRRAKAQATEAGREEARREARAELLEQFSGLGAVHAFARKLIARLRTHEERQQATEELKRAATTASNDRARIEREQRRPSSGGEQQGG